MNPWEFARREIRGAVRSVRYDLRRRRLGAETSLVLGENAPGSRQRHRIVLSGGALLLVSGGVGGYFAVAGGIDALLADGSAPGSLPAAAAPSTIASPSRAAIRTEPTSAITTTRVIDTTPRPHRTAAPPVPTPAPGCETQPPAPPTPSGGPSPTASRSPSPSRTASPAPSPSPSTGSPSPARPAESTTRCPAGSPSPSAPPSPTTSRDGSPHPETSPSTSAFASSRAHG